MLTKAEQREATKYATGAWAVLRYDATCGITTWVRREDLGNGKSRVHFIETQDATQIVEENKHLSNSWEGWAGRKHGAVVARIPIVEHNRLMRECGYDGAEYDKDKMKKLLNDGDNAAFRTGGGSL